MTFVDVKICIELEYMPVDGDSNCGGVACHCCSRKPAVYFSNEDYALCLNCVKSKAINHKLCECGMVDLNQEIEEIWGGTRNGI